MKKILKYNDNNIEELIQGIHSELLDICPEKKRFLSAVILATEEIILLYKDIMTESFRVSAEVHRDTRTTTLCIIIPGEMITPESASQKASSPILSNLQLRCDLSWDYSYEKGCNCITFTIEKYAPLKDNLLFTYKSAGINVKYLYKGTAALLISLICNLCIPAVTAQLIVGYTDNIFLKAVVTAAILTGLRLLNSISFGIANISYNKITFGIRANLETALAESILSVKEEAFDENGTGPFINRITDDLKIIADGLQTIVDRSVTLMRFVGAFVATLILDKRIFFFELFTMTVLTIIERIRSRFLDIDSRAALVSEEKRAGLITDIINGESDVKLLDGYEFFRDRMNYLATQAKDKNNHKVFRNRIMVTIGECATAICYFGIMIMLGYYLYIGEFDVSETLVLFNYFTMIGTPFAQVIQQTVEFVKSFNLSCERVRNLQDGTEFPKETFGTTHLDNMRGEITFEHVSFAYNHDNVLEEDKNIIKDVSLQIKPGETTAIVGKSGSGKSTLLRLMSKQRVCSSGRVLIDGVDIQDIDKQSLRENMMVVNQFPYLFNASIKDNLLVSKPDSTNEEMECACDAACILEDIEGMPDRYDTILGERGIRMSGGQKQRLAIARGLLKDARIILFDEATSAIDNITQVRITNALNTLHGKHTIVLIAHRLSTIMDADKIVLIDDGKIVAQGKHQELMETCEKYRELFNAE